jgi:hypothetical protein
LHQLRIGEDERRTYFRRQQGYSGIERLAGGGREFNAGNPGNALFHWHQQLRMDFAFMTLLKYV